MLKKARALYRVRIYKIKRLRCSEASFFLTRDVRHSGMRSYRTNRGETEEKILRGYSFAFYALVSLHERNRCIARSGRDRYGQQDRATNGLIFFVETFQTLFPSDTLTNIVFRTVFSFWTDQEWNFNQGHHSSIFLQFLRFENEIWYLNKKKKRMKFGSWILVFVSYLLYERVCMIPGLLVIRDTRYVKRREREREKTEFQPVQRNRNSRHNVLKKWTSSRHHFSFTLWNLNTV